MRFLIPFVLIATSAATTPPPPNASSPESDEPVRVRVTRRVSVGAVGDVLMHGAVKTTAMANRSETNHSGYDWVFAPVADLLWQPDIMFANLETPIAPRTGRPGKAFVFNAPIAVLQSLDASGVDVVSIANNHAFDQKRKGMLETLQHLEMLGLGYVGGGMTPREAGPRVFEKYGMKLAFFAWTDLLNGDGAGNECKTPCERIAQLDVDSAEKAIAAAAKKYDAVIVSLHWGSEYRSDPTDEQVEIAHRLAEAGALAILGHHPHVLQPIEVYQREDGGQSVIAYSLGNFVSNQSAKYVHGVAPISGGNTRDGALLRVEVVEKDYGHGIRRIELGQVDYAPLWTENNSSELKTRKDRKRKIAIRVVAIDRQLAHVRAQLAEMGDEIPADEQDDYVRLKKLEALYLDRRDNIAETLGREFLRTLGSDDRATARSSTPE